MKIQKEKSGRSNLFEGCKRPRSTMSVPPSLERRSLLPSGLPTGLLISSGSVDEALNAVKLSGASEPSAGRTAVHPAASMAAPPRAAVVRPNISILPNSGAGACRYAACVVLHYLSIHAHSRSARSHPPLPPHHALPPPQQNTANVPLRK